MGLPTCPCNISFYLDDVYMISGITRNGGLPGLLGRVTFPAGVAFYHVNVSGWDNPPTRGRFMLHLKACQVRIAQDMTAYCYKTSKLFLQLHLTNVVRHYEDNQEDA